MVFSSIFPLQHGKKGGIALILYNKALFITLFKIINSSGLYILAPDLNSAPHK